MKMKNLKYLKAKTILFMTLVFISTSCERDLSDDAELATFAKEGDIFIDSLIGLGSDFYFTFLG